MKLCIVSHSLVKGDGQGRVNYEVACEAIRRGHHVTVLASEIAPDLEKHHHINWVPISVKGLSTELIRNIMFAFKSTNWLKKHHNQCDIIKANGAITWANSDVNAVHFVHNSWLKFSTLEATPSANIITLNPRIYLYKFYQWLYTKLNARWEKQAFDNTKTVVAVSDKVAEDLREIGVPEQAIRVIINGVDIEEFSPENPGDRQTWDLPDGVPLAMFAGDIRIARKNLDTVLKALVEVPNLHLAVVGVTDGSPYPQLAKSLGLSDRVHFLGFRRDIPALMKVVDFFVFPSRYEPFGLVVIEAMATGLPVITASCTGSAPLITPEAGIVLPDPDDRSALAAAMQKLSENPDLRTKMGGTAREIALQHTWKEMAQKYVDLFEEMK
ncbi:glycosyltransferase [Rivularia sp. PCC 7116]|uniref:glycosyltransferase family 4 protein n=1 Tax=Rivularia sp. PCC 7116 TaxID=373994 RepID=UPI00029EE1F2|nr:glycosyltransferase family 4 protein [Rivularia sp. PCC 7116]AFY56664.1 glycosyltransferase [Rivularia sp. PCC 7116]